MRGVHPCSPQSSRLNRQHHDWCCRERQPEGGARLAFPAGMTQHGARTQASQSDHLALSRASAVAALLVLMWLGYRNIGLPPVIIVGGSGIVAFGIWNRW